MNLWLDELFCISVAKIEGLNVLQFLKESDTNPPLFYLVLTLWYKLFGDEISVLRILPILLVNIAFCFIYFTLIKNKLNTIAYASVNYFFSSLIFVFHSLDIRQYSLLILGISICIYFLYSPISIDPQKRRLTKAAYIIGLLICAYSHNFGLIFWFSHFFIYLMHYRFFHTISIKELFFTNIISFIFYLPWLPVVYYQATHSGAIDWIEPLSIRTYYIFKSWTLQYSISLIILASLYQCFRIWKSKDYKSALYISIPALYILPPFLFIFLSEALGKHLFQLRYLQQSFIALFLLLSFLFYSKRFQKSIGVFFLAFMYYQLLNFPYVKFKNLTRAWTVDWKALASEVKSLQADHTIIYHPNLFDFPLKTYEIGDKHYPAQTFNFEDIKGTFYFYTYTNKLQTNTKYLFDKLKNKKCHEEIYPTKIRRITFMKVTCL